MSESNRIALTSNNLGYYDSGSDVYSRSPESEGTSSSTIEETPTMYSNSSTCNSTGLQRILHSLGAFENSHQEQRREQVLDTIEWLLCSWVAEQIGDTPELNATQCDSWAKVLPFGSYFLKAHCAGSDIDAVCVCSGEIDAADFFSSFHDRLASTPGVRDIQPIPDAHIPVMKCKIHNIHMDLLFARYPAPFIPKDCISGRGILWQQDILDQLDENSRKSLQGRRECEEILRVVPNVDKFRFVLRCIKLWAKRRGVYKNVMGYPGGFSYSVMVGAACKMLPEDASAQQILSHFFTVYRDWMWPTPVSITPFPHTHMTKYRRDWMPVLGPLAPHSNTAHTVSLSTFRMLQYELQRASFFVNHSDENSIDATFPSWRELYQSSEFFSMYNLYLQISVRSVTAGAHLKWSSFMESRLRYYINELERIEQLYIHVFPEPINHDDDSDVSQRDSVLPPLHSQCRCAKPSEKHRFTTSFFLGIDYRGYEPLHQILEAPTEYFVSRFCFVPSKTVEMLCPIVKLVTQENLPPLARCFQVSFTKTERQNSEEHVHHHESNGAAPPKSDSEGEDTSISSAEAANSTDSEKESTLEGDNDNDNNKEERRPNGDSDGHGNTRKKGLTATAVVPTTCPETMTHTDESEKPGIWVPEWKKRRERGEEKELSFDEHSMPVSPAKKRRKRRRDVREQHCVFTGARFYRPPCRKRRKPRSDTNHVPPSDGSGSLSSSSSSGDQQHVASKAGNTKTKSAAQRGDPVEPVHRAHV